MDWTSGGAQFHSPTLHAFLINGLHHNADEGDVISTAYYIHKRICHQLAFSENLLMPNTCVPPIQTTALGTPDCLDTVKLIAEPDVKHCCNERDPFPGGYAGRPDQADEACFRGASASARSGVDCGEAYSAAEVQGGGVERIFAYVALVFREGVDAGI
eukprot:6178877-Pleurochrysis_carterae.AAC.1